MSLPFRIGDVVEIDEEKIHTDPSLVNFVGQQAVVKTMGIRWVKVAFEGSPGGFVISSNNLKKVDDGEII
jgi:predicted RNA-binding protein associated with RNAse of E/G family|tara:strand:- start:721 stop:930 length:210 start_codon:yes stop_codon:yes gene_type:complete